MTSFQPIPYTYVPTAPRSKKATAQKQCILPTKEPCNEPRRRRNGDDDSGYSSEDREINTICNSNDDEFNLDLSARYSPLQVNLREVLRLEQEVRDDEMAFQHIDNNGPTSIETILDPQLYLGASTGLPQSQDIQDIDSPSHSESRQGTPEISIHHALPVVLDSNEAGSERRPFGCQAGLFPVSNEQEKLSAGGSPSLPSNHPIELSYPQSTCDQDQSSPSYPTFEELEYTPEPYFQEKNMERCLQQHRAITEYRKRRYLSETEIDNDVRPAKQRRTRSLSINNDQTSSRHNGIESRLWPRHIESPSFTAPSPMTNSSISDFGRHSPAASNGNHCHSLRSAQSPSLVEPAPTAEYQEWPFQGFLKRTKIGNDTTYNLEFRLQDVPEQLHLPILSEALGISEVAQSVPPRSIPHSRVQPARLRAKGKRVRWEPEEHETIVRMKKDGCSWEEIHHALPHRTQAAIQVQYSTKLKK
ncbi:hypothetical protein DSL72_001431 [Monilinia vaccinii-corymbosi]|uniref:Myb-like domain-containing protein n=1 Tax=Monilinia vaccinii-corymbosi TaxID=61207 RepID=A0A8A3P3V6_9HELO|nr:hypothetical protein DSL72_001431 [Monilinia vaccinii-corymbosi]